MMVDLHQHLLFGVDDGAADEAEAKAMLDECAKQGIDLVVATPHVWPGAEELPLEELQSKLERLRHYAEKHEIELLPGAEILYSAVAGEWLEDGSVPSLGGSGCALIEFYPDTSYGTMHTAVRNIFEHGFRPVLAHMERYDCLYHHIDRVESLHNLGVVMQMNAEFVTHLSRLNASYYYCDLIKKGLIDCIASDAHNCSSRPQMMQKAREKLKRMFGHQVAEDLTDYNARCLLRE